MPFRWLGAAHHWGHPDERAEFQAQTQDVLWEKAQGLKDMHTLRAHSVPKTFAYIYAALYTVTPFVAPRSAIDRCPPERERTPRQA